MGKEKDSVKETRKKNNGKENVVEVGEKRRRTYRGRKKTIRRGGKRWKRTRRKRKGKKEKERKEAYEDKGNEKV